MFKQLYRRLTLTNALILIVFLLIFSYAIVGLSQAVFDTSAKNALQDQYNRITGIIDQYDTLEFALPEERLDSPEGISNYSTIDYIIWDEKGKIANLSSLKENLVDTCYTYAVSVQETKSDRFDTISLNGIDYRLKTAYHPIDADRGVVVQVYQSRQVDDFIINRIFFVIMGIGLFSILILIYISAHLAKKSLEPVRKSYERQKEFIADASHELRTPLTIIQTTAELLCMKKEETIEENERWIDNITSETENMSVLIQNLLTLAQADNNQIPIHCGDMDLSQVVNKNCEKFELIAREKNIAFKSIVSDQVNFYGDKEKINQLIVILLDNAIKYTPENGQITVGLMHTSSVVVFNVRDSGIGMTEEEKQRIFERFYRVDKARSRAEGGAGLGLSIAHWIVDAHKGKITVESSPNAGSNFIVEFPKGKKRNHE
ncbi:MAG TPA: hypothetical protein DHN33_02890 [Eubacteriaceae bacterium]|nr:hypothetical protein [Eubacteriaceae bacterium]